MRRLAAGLARCTAALVLIAVLVVLPVGVWAIVGGPGAIDWRTAFGSGRVVSDTVVALGLLVFTALWMWFAAIAAGEIARVMAWRRGAHTLAPVEPTPSGAVRRLVRIALVSTSTVVGAGLASLASVVPATSPVSAAAEHVRGDGLAPATWTTVGHTLDLVEGSGRRAAPANERADVRSNGRETPYSIAVRLGDATLRDRIIELNHGAPGPDGVPWTGGVFPAGMVVRVPEGVQLARTTAWTTYTVVDGDSVYRIATRLAAGDHRRVREIADAIIDRNLGRTMPDGVVFDDPSLVRIGWVIDVPADASVTAPGRVAGEAHADARSVAYVVERGESYWSIAAEHVTPPHDTAADVASLAGRLQSINVDRLGHDDPSMLHPGDELLVPVAEPVAEPMVEPVAGPVAEPAASTVPPTTVLPTTPAPTTIPTTTIPTTPAATAIPTTIPTTVPPTVPPTTPAITEAEVPASAPMTTSLAAAVLLCAGALGLVESRRRQQLRRSGPTSVVPVPAADLVHTERLVRSLDAAHRAARLDLALRSAGHLLVGTGGYVRAAIVDDVGTVTLLLDRPGRRPAAPWSDVEPGRPGDRWVLDATVATTDLVPMARLAGQPCPALVHLGRLVQDGGLPAEGELFVDLEAFGLVCIDAGPEVGGGDDVGPPGATSAIVRSIATSLAASPMSETLRLVTHGLDSSVHLGNPNAEQATDLEHALDLAAAALGSTPTAIGGVRTSELRARGVGGEAWEPVVVVSTERCLSADATRELLDLTRAGGRSLAVVLGHAVPGASLTVRAGAFGWDLAPLGLTVVPVGVDDEHVASLHRLLAAAAMPLPEAPIDTPIDPSIDTRRTRTLDWTIDRVVDPVPERVAGNRPGEHATGAADDWALMIRVLGPVEVVTSAGEPVEFERGKSLELVAWLGQHRAQATRTGARTALWELAVRDATFANVVSDARRSLARAVAAPEGEDWVGRSTTGHLPLHPLVVTDAEVLRRRLDRSRSLRGEDAIRVLRPGVALIRDLPFAGTDFLWPASEGLTSSLTQLATAAATELARLHLELGDVDGVFWATGQGLLALPGHEELICLRMRAHAQRGDLAGVRVEWESYERAITADVWSDGEPSPKLLALRRELLNR